MRIVSHTDCIFERVAKKNESEHRGTQWLLDMSEIEPGSSAILGNNKLIFYTIHLTGIIVILTSVICSVLVIISVYQSQRKLGKWDFSDRFPIYLAVSDGLWGLSNLSADHIILVVQQVFPEKRIATGLAVNVSFFFGYQQLMSAGLSFYTYLRVTRKVSLNLGPMEWKLHAVVVTFLAANIGFYWSLDAFGNSGFWFLADLKSDWGIVFAINICTSCTIHAILTTFAYRSIQNVIKNQKRVVSTYSQYPSSHNEAENKNQTVPHQFSRKEVKKNDPVRKGSFHSTAVNCLTTFVYISLLLYVPVALSGWIYVMFGMFGYIEPITSFIVVISANSGGWVNACGYFHNKRIKDTRRKLIMQQTRGNLAFTSSSGSNI